MLIDDEVFLKQVQEDMFLDKDKIEDEIVSMPVKRDRYLKLFTKCKRKYIQKEIEVQNKRSDLFVYYNEKYEIQLKPSEIEHYITNNDEMKALNREYQELKIDFEYLKECISNINSKSWDVKNLIEYRRQIYNLGINPEYN